MANPWDVRPVASTGDWDPNHLFTAVGRALTEWAQLENAWSEVFAIIIFAPVRKKFQAPAIRAYGSVNTFNGRCAMLSAAGEAFFHKRHRKRQHVKALEPKFRQLITESLQFAGRRNEIAHGEVDEILFFKPRHKPRSLGYFLLPSLYNPKKFKLTEEVTFQYTSGDVIYYSQEFTKLRLRIGGLRNELSL